MIICPDCNSENLNADSKSCAVCSWKCVEEDSISNYLSTKDRESEISDRYINNYETLASKNLLASNIDRRFLKNQAKNLVRYLGAVNGLNVCDVGVGQGFLCDELLMAGVKSLVAVDVSRSYLSRFRGQERVTPCLANAESLPFKNEFDLLVTTDVLEHVLNAGAFLFSINRALRVRGRVAIRVPYREGLLNYTSYRGFELEFGHLRSFNQDILQVYLEQAGFAVRGFYLDGFSPGSPQPFLYSSDKRKALYHRILAVMNRFLEHPADATLWNSRLARVLMRPAEIVVVARKELDL